MLTGVVKNGRRSGLLSGVAARPERIPCPSSSPRRRFCRARENKTNEVVIVVVVVQRKKQINQNLTVVVVVVSSSWL